MRTLCALGRYELTAHGKNEMEQDGFSIRDVKWAIMAVELCVANGTAPDGVSTS